MALFSTLVASALGPVANPPMGAAISAIAAQTSAEEYHARGVARQQAGDAQGAIEDYTQALRLNPNDAAAYNNRGAARATVGDAQGAIEDYTQALRLDSNDADAYYNRGVVRRSLGDAQGAIEDYTQALRLDPNDADAYYNRGIARGSLGDQQGASEDYTQALRLDPNHAAAYNNRGVVRRSLGDLQGAIEDYTQALRLNPNDALAYHNRGVVRRRLEDTRGAREDLQRAAELFRAQGDLANSQAALDEISALADTPSGTASEGQPGAAGGRVSDPPTRALASGGPLAHRYANTTFAWSMSYPEGWTVDASDPAFVRIALPSVALMGVHSTCFSGSRTLDEVTDPFLSGMEQSLRQGGRTFRIVTRGSIALAGDIPAVDTLIELGPGGRTRIVSTLVGGCVFVVNAETREVMWPQLEGVFNEMIRSLSFP
jgi:Flp pilus assembly protein TadD